MSKDHSLTNYMTDHRLAFFISIVATALIGYIDYQTGTRLMCPWPFKL